MTGKRLVVCLALSCAIILGIGKADAGRSPSHRVNVTVLTSGLDFPIGSTIGPDVITDGLDLPASMQFIGDTAYIVTLTGEILKIDDVSK